MTLPPAYQWLYAEPGPRMLMEAIAEYGTLEVPGKGSNHKIEAWATECGIGAYSTDAIPWCGLFMAMAAKRATWARPASPLWARAWSTWGIARLGPALLGDVLVFTRVGGGHVAMYIGEDPTHYHILGGNQSDKVSIVRHEKNQIATRHAPWRVMEPPNVRRVYLSPHGTPISGSEA